MPSLQVAGGWRRPIQVSDVAIADSSSGECVASLEGLRTSKSLWGALMGREFDVIASKPWADCSLGPDGQPRLAQALAVLPSLR